MNAIMGIVDILMENDNISDDFAGGLSRIYNSCSMLLGIINDLLDFSKIEAGKLDIDPAPYKVAALINDAVQLNMMHATEKSIEFELQVDESLPAMLIGDELRIKQILSNLLSNAFKYTDDGKVTLSVVCEEWPNKEGVTLVLIVRDTGCGLSKEQLDRIFDKYSRFVQKNAATVEGTGLGLAITQSLVNLMDGGIEIESEPGVGSVFVVKLPQKKVDNEVLGKEMAENLKHSRMDYFTRSKREKISRDFMPYGTVLVVDDVETNLYVSSGLMKPYGVQVETAVSGFEALDKIKNGYVYDIIFMDHMMPEMDGMETTQRMRDMGYDHAIVALTANAVVGQAEIFLQNGFDGFISKPIDIRQLDAILNKYVRDKQTPETIEAANQQRDNADKYIIDGHVIDIETVRDYLLNNEPALSSDKADSSLLGKEIDGLDIIKGLKRYDGDVGTYLGILRSYASSVRSILASIEIVEEDKLQDYKIKVHGIKGASLDIFADKIGNAAKKLEDAAKDGDFEYILKKNSKFRSNAYKLIESLDEMFVMLKAGQPKSEKPKSEKPVEELLAKLSEACKVYNLDEAEAAMTEIEAYQDEFEDGLVDWLRENVDMMNFAEIVDRLSE